MASIFNSLASIVRAYILPPKLDAEQIEEATRLAQVRWLDESSADLPRPRSTRIASRSSPNVRFVAPLLADATAHCPYCMRAKSLLQRELGQECKVRRAAGI